MRYLNFGVNLRTRSSICFWMSVHAGEANKIVLHLLSSLCYIIYEQTNFLMGYSIRRVRGERETEENSIKQLINFVKVRSEGIELQCRLLKI